jgi:hypothetical protein
MAITKITLTRSAMHRLFTAIKRMDGDLRPVKGADGKTTVAQEPYKFTTVQPIYAMAKTRSYLQPEIAASEKVQRTLVAGYPAKDDTAGRAAIDEKMADFMSENVEVQVHALGIIELDIHKNNIPPSVLADLMPMLTGDL